MNFKLVVKVIPPLVNEDFKIMAPRVFSVSDKSVGVSSASSPAEMKQKACNVLPGFTKKCKACTSQWTQQVVVSKVWKFAVLLTTSRNTTATTKKRSVACPHHTHNALLLHLGRAKAAVWAFSFYSFTLQFDSETTWLQFAIQGPQGFREQRKSPPVTSPKNPVSTIKLSNHQLCSLHLSLSNPRVHQLHVRNSFQNIKMWNRLSYQYWTWQIGYGQLLNR